MGSVSAVRVILDACLAVFFTDENRTCDRQLRVSKAMIKKDEQEDAHASSIDDPCGAPVKVRCRTSVPRELKYISLYISTSTVAGPNDGHDGLLQDFPEEYIDRDDMFPGIRRDALE